MPHVDVLDKNRKKIGEAIICIRGRHVNYCEFCSKEGLRQLAGKLCDFRLESGKTCDKSICEYHAQVVGKDLDYCPDHRQPELLP